MGKWGMSESTLRIPIFKIRGTVPINAGRGSTANKCTVVQFNCFKSAPAFLFTLEGQIGKVKNSAPPCQYSTTRYLTCRQKFVPTTGHSFFGSPMRSIRTTTLVVTKDWMSINFIE